MRAAAREVVVRSADSPIPGGGTCISPKRHSTLRGDHLLSTAGSVVLAIGIGVLPAMAPQRSGRSPFRGRLAEPERFHPEQISLSARLMGITKHKAADTFAATARRTRIVEAIAVTPCPPREMRTWAARRACSW